MRRRRQVEQIGKLVAMLAVLVLITGILNDSNRLVTYSLSGVLIGLLIVFISLV